MQTNRKPDLSIIVPAFNEERFIGRQLGTLRRHTASLRTQIIVVDNGSRDRTMEIASRAGADIVLQRFGTVASIRNAGASLAEADVLTFMDADVFPTEAWAARIAYVVEQARAMPMITGSWVSVPEECSWIEKYWFRPLEHGASTHINSGHMIISKRLFAELGGFDPRLRTGEDYDLSIRARDTGAQLIDNVELKVIHEGYPKNVREFFGREVWHGTGDFQSLNGFLSSKIAMLGFVVLHGQLLGWTTSLLGGGPVWGALSTGASLVVSSLASAYRYRACSLRTRIVNASLYFTYFLARGLSMYAFLAGRGNSRTRAGA